MSEYAQGIMHTIVVLALAAAVFCFGFVAGYDTAKRSKP